MHEPACIFTMWYLFLNLIQQIRFIEQSVIIPWKCILKDSTATVLIPRFDSMEKIQAEFLYYYCVEVDREYLE